MYANMRFQTDLSNWDGHDAEELRDRVIRDLFGYLGSGECSEDCTGEYRDALKKFQAERNQDQLKELIQDYYWDLFDAMQFCDTDPETAAGSEFSVYREVLGLTERETSRAANSITRFAGP